MRWAQDNPFAAVVPAATPWRLVVFVMAGAVWLLPAAGAWLMGLVGLVGWSSENDSSSGLLEDPSAGSLATVLFAVFVIVVAAAVLVVLARWAMPSRRRAATVLGVAAALWLPAVLTLGTLGTVL